MAGLIRTYTELMQIPDFEDRFRYLKLGGVVGRDTFGFDRYLNQKFYQSDEWRRFRRDIILRDFGCDLACRDREIGESRDIRIHHMNPLTIADFNEASDNMMNPEFVICTFRATHEAIHFGDESLLPHDPIERKPNDTCPWR